MTTQLNDAWPFEEHISTADIQVLTDFCERQQGNWTDVATQDEFTVIFNKLAGRAMNEIDPQTAEAAKLELRAAAQEVILALTTNVALDMLLREPTNNHDHLPLVHWVVEVFLDEESTDLPELVKGADEIFGAFNNDQVFELLAELLSSHNSDTTISYFMRRYFATTPVDHYEVNLQELFIMLRNRPTAFFPNCFYALVEELQVHLRLL